MASLNTTRRIWLAALFALGLAGCKAPIGQPVNPGTNTITIKPWIVLATQDGGVGALSNDGCRLSQTQVMSELNALKSATPLLFGSNVSLNILPIAVVHDPMYPGGSPRSEPISTFELVLELGAIPNDPNALNVYFTGNVVFPPPAGVDWSDPQNELSGLAYDPHAAFFGGGAPPYVLINDGGYDTQFGLVEQPSSFNDRAVLAHEVTHYLARFAGRTFITVWAPNILGGVPTEPPRRYDNGEHVEFPGPFFPPAFPSILLSGSDELPFPRPRPLYLPGSHRIAQTETQEIWSRINSGNWNNP